MASSWGGAWGSSWGVSWGDTGVAPVARRVGDDAGYVRRRRKYRPEDIIAIVEAMKAAEEEAQPRPTAKKRKALARKIVETIDEDNIFTQALKKPVAQFVRQEVAHVYQPGVSWSEVYTAVTRIIEAAQAEARRIEQEIEDEDEFLILMAA
jgi:transposase-like protein